MNHQGTKVLETRRLLLRPFRADDAEAMYRNWASDAEVTRFLTWPPHDDPEFTRTLAAQWEQSSHDPAFYQWAIVPKDLGEPIGGISVVRIDPSTESMELGYCIGKRWWGRGLMTEAVRAVVGYLFAEVGVRRVCAQHDTENPASGAVMRKAGMTKDGVLRQGGRNNRGIVDTAVYSILREEWAAER